MERHLPVDVAVIEIIMAIGKEFLDLKKKKISKKSLMYSSQNYLIKLFF